ncbi:MAG: type VI secretion protein IcmF/TssM N-terminal domain-containing protein [Phycisphaerales bacterium]
MSDEKKSPFTVMGGLYVLGGTLTISSIAGLFLLPDNPIFQIMLISVVAMAAALGVYRLVLMLRDKSKSGPFAKLLTRSSAGGAVDPATKARMDDLRRKFDEGVDIYKKAGKDLYTLPWFLLVGPSGSGKTEALRRSNVGFPQGLQDCLQGAGGTLNMHWWFTNAAVVLDTAGRLFMQEDDREWKEFMRLLKDSRPNCPINGLILVISSENLLMDSAEQIESTAGKIARKLDEMQRILDVRFPVNVIVTKCDKIIGFRDFFETLSDPILQHQVLGWANPSPLDEAFKPDLVEKHLESVRQKLVKRRMGLIQNPVHTEDASARRIDQVDEMFELPDNFMRIAPRLRLYLEKIFVAGEWSPKPLFLRGIYFTSSMREGAALDMSLAQALGVEVQSLPGSRDWDRDKAYFLKDLFLERVFKERGLVTRATNVDKQVRGQRMTVIAVTAAMLLVSVGAGLYSYLAYSDSLGKPADFWKQVWDLDIKLRDKNKVDPNAPAMPLLALGGDAPKYVGSESFVVDDLGDLKTPVEVIGNTREHVNIIEIPAMARPIELLSGVSGGFGDEQAEAHRAVVEVNVLRPVIEAAREKLDREDNWGPLAVGALRELVRLQTYAMRGVPSDAQRKLESAGGKPEKGAAPVREVIDVDALYLYVLEASKSDTQAYLNDCVAIKAAVAEAYTPAVWAKTPPEKGWAHPSSGWAQGRIDAMALHKIQFEADSKSNFGQFQELLTKLSAFSEKEESIKNAKYVSAPDSSANSRPVSLEDYQSFETQWNARWAELSNAFNDLSGPVSALGTSLDDPYAILTDGVKFLNAESVQAVADLLDQLPEPPAADAKATKANADAAAADEFDEIRQALLKNEKQLKEKLAAKQTEWTGTLRSVAPLMASGAVQGRASMFKAYEVRYWAYEAANEFLGFASAPTNLKELPSLADIDTALTRKVKTATEKVRLHEGWAPERSSLDRLRCTDDEIVKAMNTASRESVSSSTKAVELGKSRLAHEQIKEYLRLSPKGTNTDRANELVKKIAEGSGDKQYNQPDLPLSAFKKDDPFNPEYHPWAAKKWLTDWMLLERRLAVKLSAAGGPEADAAVLAGSDLSNSNDYTSARGVVEAYVNGYAEYWQERVLIDAMPKDFPDSWALVPGSLSNCSSDQVYSGLKSLRDMVLGAKGRPTDYPCVVDAIPEDLAKRAPKFQLMKEVVTVALSPLADEEFGAKSRKMLSAWTALAGGSGSPSTAAGVLLQSMAEAKASNNCADYFAVPAGGPNQPGYWRELARLCTRALQLAAQGAVADAKKVFSVPGASPLCRASRAGGLQGVSVPKADLVLKVREAAVLLSRAGGGSSAGGRAAYPCVKGDIENDLVAMSGNGQVDATTSALAERVRNLCDALSKEELQIVISAQLGSDINNTVYWNDAQYLELRKDRQSVDSFLAGTEDKTLSIPLKGRVEQYELFFYNAGNNNNTIPVATIPLNGTWPLLHEMLASGNMTEVLADGKSWIEFIMTSDGKQYRLRVQVKYDKDKTLNVKDWPTVEEWRSN